MLNKMFGGMFGGKPEMQNVPDALGQASMGAPQAMGQGMPDPGFLSNLFSRFQNMDPRQKALMMDRMGKGFNMASAPFNTAPVQMQNQYRNMTPSQPGVMFDPRMR